MEQLETRLEPIIAAATNWAWDHWAVVLVALLVVGLLGAISKELNAARDRNALVKAIRTRK